MSDVEVKARVRARDEYKCRKCGMTQEAHQEQYETQLEVHRVLPGCEYDERFCVTLCHECHRTRPRRMDRAIFADKENRDIVCFFFNLWDATDAKAIAEIQTRADAAGVDLAEMLDRLINQAIESPLMDYVI